MRQRRLQWVCTRVTADTAPAVRAQIEANNPHGEFADPEDVAIPIALLATPASDYVNGREFRADGDRVLVSDCRTGSGEEQRRVIRRQSFPYSAE